jgi:hypothetical protein
MKNKAAPGSNGFTYEMDFQSTGTFYTPSGAHVPPFGPAIS